MNSTSNDQGADTEPDAIHREYESFIEEQAHVKDSTRKLNRTRFRTFPDPDKLDAAHFRKRMKKVAPATIKHEVALARRWLKWAGRDITFLDRDNLKLPRIEDSVTVEDLYSKDELNEIFKSCLNTRDRAMLEVLYESAARAAELLSMTWQNTTFNEDNTATIIIKGKTGTRLVPLYESVPALKAWLHVHPTGDGAVWTSLIRPFHLIRTRQLYEVMQMAIERVGITRKVKRIVHNLRHTRITELVRLGIHGQALSKLVGWTKRSNMEAVYVHLSTEDVKNELHAKVFGIATKREKPRPLLESMTCPRCKTHNDQTARICSDCSMPLSNDAIVQALEKQERLEMAATGAIVADVLGGAFDDMFSQYMQSHGEAVSELLQPIVNRMLSEERKKQSGA